MSIYDELARTLFVLSLNLNKRRRHFVNLMNRLGYRANTFYNMDNLYDKGD